MRDATMRGIYPLPSGRFQLKIQVAGNAISGTFPTIADAQATRDAAYLTIAAGGATYVDEDSLLALTEKFLKTRRNNRSGRADEGRWRDHIQHTALARKPPSLIVPVDIFDWLDDLKEKATYGTEEKTLSWQTRKHCLNLLRAFFKWAVKRGLCTVNPCLGVIVDRVDGDEDEGWQESWYLDPQEQADQLANASKWDPQAWRMFRVALGAGLRLNELLCLHIANVHVEHPDGPHLEVVYGTWNAKQQRFRAPKGKTGEKKPRKVPLFGMALEAVLEQLADMPERNEYRLFFPSRWGGRRTKPPKIFSTDALGVVRIGRGPHGNGMWWHLLRHACATSLLAGWWGKRWALEDVCKFLGHSSVKVTEKYAHKLPSVIQEVAMRAQASWLAGGPIKAAATSPEKLASGGAGVSEASPAPIFHGASTLSVFLEEKSEIGGLLSRRSLVRIQPGTPAKSLRNPSLASSGVEDGVEELRTDVARTLRAFADADPARERMAVETLGRVLGALAPGGAGDARDQATAGRGTSPPKRYGEANSNAHLTDHQVGELRRRAASGEPQRILAAAFGVSQSTVWRLKHGVVRKEAT